MKRINIQMLKQIILICIIFINSNYSIEIPSDLKGDDCIYDGDKKGLCLHPTYCKTQHVKTISGTDDPRCYDEFRNVTRFFCCSKWPKKRHTNTLLTPNNCGTRKTKELLQERIVGGEEAKPGDWPWVVGIGSKNENGTVSWFCGGVLFLPQFILTAAHCYYQTEEKPSIVRLGTLNLQAPDERKVDVAIDKFIIHSNFDRQLLHNDIAVIKLKMEIQLTDYISPICLPISEKMRKNTFKNDVLIVTGWGSLEYRGAYPEGLMKVELDAFSEQECHQIYASRHVNITERQLCAGSSNNRWDACQGDSGGPLMTYDSDTNAFFAVGLVSFGYKCAEVGYPGVYTKISAFVDWIERTVIDNL